ncbi:MAG: nitroreductase/quinone reductase family protein [Blastococcus sp.]
MPLAEDLSYEFRPPNRAQRALQAVASSRPGAWFFAHTAPTLDTWVDRLSRGRTSLSMLLAGLPVLLVTTTGRKSGRRRTTHLIAIPLGDTLALVGSNFGQPATPAWALNLEADPRATATYRGRSVAVLARQAADGEFDEVLRRAAPLYGGYAAYRERIGDSRRLRIFVLEPNGNAADTPAP